MRLCRFTAGEGGAALGLVEIERIGELVNTVVEEPEGYLAPALAGD